MDSDEARLSATSREMEGNPYAAPISSETPPQRSEPSELGPTFWYCVAVVLGLSVLSSIVIGGLSILLLIFDGIALGRTLIIYHAARRDAYALFYPVTSLIVSWIWCCIFLFVAIITNLITCTFMMTVAGATTSGTYQFPDGLALLCGGAAGLVTFFGLIALSCKMRV